MCSSCDHKRCRFVAQAQSVDTSSKKSLVWKLLEPVHFQHEVDFEESPKPDVKPYRAPEGAIKWNARVSAMYGLFTTFQLALVTIFRLHSCQSMPPFPGTWG